MTRANLLDHLAHRIAAIERPHPVRIALDGIDTAGKTTLADELVAPLTALGRPVIRVSVDDLHRPRAERYRQGAASPAGYYHDTFDTPALKNNLLEPLGPGGDRAYRVKVYDLAREEPVLSPMQTAPPNAILLVDGVFLLRPELFAYWELRIHLAITFETLLRRAVQRDATLFGSPEAARERYKRKYIPGQQLYLAEAQPADRADIVINNNDPVNPVIVRDILLP